jgi:transcriptional regulator with XRE-family HTH domain
MTTNALSRLNVESCTVKDVARLAGVSIATVSRVVHGADEVSSETRAKVLDAISRLQYCPNTHAAELGRASGAAIRRRRGIQVTASARARVRLPSDSGANAQNSRRQKWQSPLLKDERSQVRGLVTKLSKDLEKLSRIVQ